VIRREADRAIDNSFNILRSRIDRFGVTQPNIQRLETHGRILVELPGIREPERVRSLLQGTANLEFWETYENQDIYPYLLQANERIRELNEAERALRRDAEPGDEIMPVQPEPGEELAPAEELSPEESHSLIFLIRKPMKRFLLISSWMNILFSAYLIR
jgi:SecD/SecF fusion protein